MAKMGTTVLVPFKDSSGGEMEMVVITALALPLKVACGAQMGLRTMRKHGFIVVQDKPGRAQTQAEQFRRAQGVAADMLGVAVDNTDGLLSNLAIEIVKVANAADGLGQFK